MNSAIIVAAGSGKRMKANINKQFLCINKKEVLAHAIEKFYRCDEIDEIIVCIRKDEENMFRELIVEKYGYENIKIAYGGAERQDTIKNGLEKLDENSEIVLIHDGARPFITEEIIKDAVEKTKEYGATVVGVPVKDTIKIVKDGVIEDTPDRSIVWAAQTPQSFKRDIVEKAYKKAYEEGFYGTDDAMLAEKVGYRVHMVMGSYDNIKITSPEDLGFAESIEKRIR